MKPPSVRLFAAGVAVVAALLCWYLLSMQPETLTQAAKKVPPLPAPGTNTPPAAVPAQPWESLRVPKFESTSPGALKWLEARGRDAAGLIALWQLSGEEALLMEAAKKFPDDPIVCRALIHHHRKDAPEALPWIERLIAAEPKNPEGYYQKTRALMTNGDRAEALTVLRQAVTVGYFNNEPRREGYNILNGAALAGGARPRDAALLALRATQQHSLMETTLSGATAVVHAELAAAKAAGSEERLLDIAGLGFTAAENIGTCPGLSLQDAWAATSLEMEIYSELSGDTEFGAGGRTAAALKIDTEHQREYLTETLTEAKAAGDFLLNATDEAVATYAGCFIGHGEQVATDDALSQFRRKTAVGAPVR